MPGKEKDRTPKRRVPRSSRAPQSPDVPTPESLKVDIAILHSSILNRFGQLYAGLQVRDTEGVLLYVYPNTVSAETMQSDVATMQAANSLNPRLILHISHANPGRFPIMPDRIDFGRSEEVRGSTIFYSPTESALTVSFNDPQTVELNKRGSPTSVDSRGASGENIAVTVTNAENVNTVTMQTLNPELLLLTRGRQDLQRLNEILGLMLTREVHVLQLGKSVLFSGLSPNQQGLVKGDLIALLLATEQQAPSPATQPPRQIEGSIGDDSKEDKE